jgi:hypothetical protein
MPREKLEFLHDTLALFSNDSEFFRRTGRFKLLRQDSSFDQLRRLDPAFNKLRMNASLGNMGTAVNPMVFSLSSHTMPRSGFKFLDNYLFLAETAPVYISPRPFSEICYQLGSNSEHYFNVLHTQQINSNLSLGLEYRHLNSAGTYRRQDATYHNARIFGRYRSANGKYRIMGQVIHNAFTVQENGGLQNDSNFILNGLFSGPNLVPNLNRATYPIHLESAFRQGFQNQVYIYQHLSFSGKSADSLRRERPRFSIGHGLDYQNGEDRYNDPNALAAFYPAILVDSAQSLHRMQWETLSNEFALRFFLRPEKPGGSPISLGVRHGLYRIIQRTDTIQGDTLPLPAHEIITSGQHVEAFSGLSAELGVFTVDANAGLVLSGYNLGDIKLEAQFSAAPDSGRQKLILYGGYYLREADIIAARFSSNHRRWDQSFSKQQFLKGGVKWRWEKAKLEVQAGFWLVTNYVYFGENVPPQQDNGAHTVMEARVSKPFRAGNFRFELFSTAQFSSTVLIPLPLAAAHGDIAYENRFFKKNLLLRIGLDVYYHTPYFAQGYDPVTGQFFVQNARQTGGYPFADIYMAARIRQVRFWFKFRNGNQGLPAIPYFLTPGHPMQDRSIQVGLQWAFYN